MTDARRERMTELLEQRRYAAALDEAVTQLKALGVPVHRDHAVTKEAVREAHERAGQQDRFHLIWHRVWGVRLRNEVLETSARLAAMLQDERAVLVWLSRASAPANAVSSPHVGFLMPVAPALRQLPSHIGPEEGAVGPGGSART